MGLLRVAAPALIVALVLASTVTSTVASGAAQTELRTLQTVKAMTRDEKLSLIFGYFSTDIPNRHWQKPNEGLADSAGYVPGVPRLGLPAQFQTDAGLGVATQRSLHPRHRTALPSGLAMAATWNPELARAGGAMIGNEAKLSGFNVMLAGGVNLIREPRNGRNFEYAGEDPLLAGTMVGEQIRGIQSNHILSTVKHFAFNDQESSRTTVNAKIGEAAARMSDLRAFEIAIRIGDPAAVMCAYNRVNSIYACESDWLIKRVLKHDWNFQGFVLSDWGATHSTAAAVSAGLDQESGYPFDDAPYFRERLQSALAKGEISEVALGEMATRIVRELITKGVIDDPVDGDHSKEISYASHARLAQNDSEESIVLLKNEGLLPLKGDLKKIAVIGGHADIGVLSGGGSSQVYVDDGGTVPNEGPADFPGPMVYYPSSPKLALQRRTSASVRFDSGRDLKTAVALAASSDVVIVFATQWTAESIDVPNLSLPREQDKLIAAVAAANPQTVVVLETGGPVLMPWLKDVRSVLEAWYPGVKGGDAIAGILTGQINPSGHLPVTFPASEQQLPRPSMSFARVSTADYTIEGAAVGYKWFDRQALKPLFPFGYGLSYTQFIQSDLKVEYAPSGLITSFTIKNVGSRAGSTVVQVYAEPVDDQTRHQWESPKRLVGWSKVWLPPGGVKTAKVTIDMRSLATYDVNSQDWTSPSGHQYRISIGESSASLGRTLLIKGI